MTNLLNILYLGFGVSALCFVTWNYVVRRLGAVKTSVYIYMVPVITVGTSALVLNEKITVTSGIGTMLKMDLQNEKCVMVIDEHLPLGIITNAVAIMGITLGKKLPEVVEQDVYDNTGKEHLGIVPIIAPKEVIDSGLCKETKKCETKAGFASVCLKIDYETYVDADIDEKMKLIIYNVLVSVKAIHSRAKIDFGEFSKDIMQYCEQAGIVL